jgi:hypothetical protein
MMARPRAGTARRVRAGAERTRAGTDLEQPYGFVALCHWSQL